MLELLGRSYVVEFCLAEMEEHFYKIYVTDALKVIAENIAKIGGGTTLKNRFVDALPQRYADEVEDDGSSEKEAEEIKNRIMEGVNAL